MKLNHVFSSFLAMLALALGASVPVRENLIGPSPIEAGTTAMEKRQSTPCFPKVLASVAGTQTISYGLLNVSAVVRAAFNLCDDNTCSGSNTLYTFVPEGDAPWDIQVSASGEYTSPAVRDMLLTGLIGLSWAGVTISHPNGNNAYTAPSSFNVQLQCNGVTDSITLTMSAGSPAQGDCSNWVGAATDFVWDAVNVLVPDLFPIGGVIAGMADAICDDLL